MSTRVHRIARALGLASSTANCAQSCCPSTLTGNGATQLFLGEQPGDSVKVRSSASARLRLCLCGPLTILVRSDLPWPDTLVESARTPWDSRALLLPRTYVRRPYPLASPLPCPRSLIPAHTKTLLCARAAGAEILAVDALEVRAGTLVAVASALPAPTPTAPAAVDEFRLEFCETRPGATGADAAVLLKGLGPRCLSPHTVARPSHPRPRHRASICRHLRARQAGVLPVPPVAHPPPLSRRRPPARLSPHRRRRAPARLRRGAALHPPTLNARAAPTTDSLVACNAKR